MSHFLYAMWDGGGSLPPELTVARRLVEAGHTVTVLSDPVVEPEARAVGVSDFRAWVEAPHHVTRRKEDDYVRDWEIKNPIAEWDNLLDTVMVKPAPLFAAETLAAIDDVRPDVVLSTFALIGSLLAAEQRSLPHAATVPNALTIPTPGMPPPGMLPARGAIGRLRDRALHPVTGWVMNRGLSGLNEARSALGLAPVDRFLSQWFGADRVLVLTGRAFDFPAVLPANVRYVGPQLDDPAWAAPWAPPADDGRPLVLIAMSTTFMDHVDQLQRAVTALGSLPVRGLVTTGLAVDPEEITAPENVTVVRSAPHNQVLAHADALLTHAGHGTVVRALVAGVPMVCMPTGRDQPDNAARVRHHGAGVSISKKSSPDKIAGAVRRVLADSSYRTSSARVGDRMLAEVADGAVIRELEGLVRPPEPDAKGRDLPSR